MGGDAPVAVGVVVVHHGDGAPTRACLASVLGDPSGVARTVVVVDNSANLTPGDFPGVVVLPRPDNPGFGGGANAGVEALGTGPWVALVVLNHDVVLSPGYLDRAAAVLETGGGAAAGPLFLGDDGERLWYAGGWINFVLGTVHQSRSPAAARRARWVGFLPGAAVVVSPAAWGRVGGFDPSFFLYNEDVDLCLRLRRAGFRLRFDPELRAVHHLGAATGSHLRSPFYLEHLTRTRLQPFRPRAYRAYLAMLHTAYVGIRAAFLALTRGRNGRKGAAALFRGQRAALRGLLTTQVVTRESSREARAGSRSAKGLEGG